MSTQTFNADIARALVNEHEKKVSKIQAEEKRQVLAVIEDRARNGKRMIEIGDIRRAIRLTRATPEITMTDDEIAKFLADDCFFYAEKTGTDPRDGSYEWVISW